MSGFCKCHLSLFPGVSRKQRPKHARGEHISGSGCRVMCAHQPIGVERLYSFEI